MLQEMNSPLKHLLQKRKTKQKNKTKKKKNKKIENPYYPYNQEWFGHDEEDTPNLAED